MTLHDTKTYAGEKGGANRDLIMNNAAFARTRENMAEFGGCGIVVKAIRRGFLNLLPDQTDSKFTGRLMKLIKLVNCRDIEGARGKRSIIFSATRPIFLTLVFNVLQDIADMVQNSFVFSHPVSRAEATLKLTAMTIKSAYIPKGATHFRVQNHLSVISDYSYSEMNRRYEALDPFNAQSTFKYSEYTSIKTPLTAELNAQFPVGTVIGDDATVIQCVGVEFFISTNGKDYEPLQGSSMMVVDAF